MGHELTDYIKELGLDDYHEFLHSIARPTVEIITTSAPVTPGCSKFGGSPDVPTAFEWPDHRLGPYRFIGQFNLADIPKGPHGLPRDGLLSFFYAEDENGESFWGDPDYVRVYRFDGIEALKSVQPPAAVLHGATSRLSFQPGVDVPVRPWWDESAIKEWPIDDSSSDAYWELRCRLHPSGRYLMGYPFNSTLAYDPTPGPEWRSLLTLNSDDDLEWCWHDGDWLVTFIEEQRLGAADFSQIKSDAG